MRSVLVWPKSINIPIFDTFKFTQLCRILIMKIRRLLFREGVWTSNFTTTVHLRFYQFNFRLELFSVLDIWNGRNFGRPLEQGTVRLFEKIFRFFEKNKIFFGSFKFFFSFFNLRFQNRKFFAANLKVFRDCCTMFRNFEGQNISRFLQLFESCLKFLKEYKLTTVMICYLD